MNLSKPSYPDHRSSQSLQEGRGGPTAGPPPEDIASDDEFGGDDRSLRRSQPPAAALENKTPSVASDRDKVNNNLDEKSSSFPSTVPPAGDGLPKDASQLSNVYGLIGNIQALLKAAVENTSKDKGKNAFKSNSRCFVKMHSKVFVDIC